MVLAMPYLNLADDIIKDLFVQKLENEVQKLEQINRNWRGAYNYLMDNYIKRDARFKPQGLINDF